MKANFLALGISLLLLWAYLGLVEYIRPCFFLYDDNASSYIANFLHSYRTLFSTGRIAEMNYFQYGGSPFLEQGQSAVFYLPTYLSVFLAREVTGSALWTIEWMVVLHLTAGQIGLFCLLRSWRVEPYLAAIGGLLWVLSPFVVILSSCWVAVTYIVSYTPWILLGIDRLLKRPGLKSCLSLALPIALFFLTGALQFLIFVLFFAGLFGLLSLRQHPPKRPLRVVLFLALSALVVFCAVMPMFAPMLHEAKVSAHRSGALSLQETLLFSLDPGEFIKTQFLVFESKTLYGGFTECNSSYFLCLEIFLVPLMLLALSRAKLSTVQLCLRLFLLALVALVLSTKCYVVFSLLPVFDHFRWPFKLFIYFKLFLISFILIGLSCWIKEGNWNRSRHLVAIAALMIILVTNGIVIGRNQAENVLSYAHLTSLTSPISRVIDPTKGRVFTVGIWGTKDYNVDRYLSHNFSTTFEIPHLGGYDPSVGLNQANFGLDLNFCNVYFEPITPEYRKLLNERCVRYFILNTAFLNGKAALELKNIKVLLEDKDRAIVENEEADPMVLCQGATVQPGQLSYSGNSLFIPVPDNTTRIGVSLSQTYGWNYRLDGGPWLKPDYAEDRLWCAIPPSSHLLEVTYFDPFLRQGIWLSLGGLLVLSAVGGVMFFLRKDKLAARPSNRLA